MLESLSGKSATPADGLPGEEDRGGIKVQVCGGVAAACAIAMEEAGVGSMTIRQLYSKERTGESRSQPGRLRPFAGNGSRLSLLR